MSEEQTTEQKENADTKAETPAAAKTTSNEAVQLPSIFAFKVGMSSYFDEKGEMQPATILKYETLVVSQLKTKDKDGYAAVQVAFKPKREKRTLKSEKNHLKGTGFENGAYFVRELRVKTPDGLAVGTRISIDSLKVGDKIKVTSISKGKGFMGVIRRWNNAGGPATHGSGFHRQPGSIGNRTWPGRVMPGKHFPGHMGDETVTVKGLDILDVLPEENVIIVRGPVPGAKNTLVQLTKV